MSSLERVMRAIDALGAGEYQDGSSTKAGHIYHPLPFPELAGVPVHKPHAEREMEVILDDLGTSKDQTILDIGCAVGMYLFNLAPNTKLVIGYEGDRLAFNVASAIAAWQKIENVRLINEYIGPDTDIPRSDTCIFMNCHMWIWKQHGPYGSLRLLRKIKERTGKMYFQTAHASSDGRYRISDLKDEAAVKRHLQAAGFSTVRKIGNSRGRYLFVCQP